VSQRVMKQTTVKLHEDDMKIVECPIAGQAGPICVRFTMRPRDLGAHSVPTLNSVDALTTFGSSIEVWESALFYSLFFHAYA
jgi:hypothetical protein